jgi:hypothetical protein
LDHNKLTPKDKEVVLSEVNQVINNIDEQLTAATSSIANAGATAFDAGKKVEEKLAQATFEGPEGPEGPGELRGQEQQQQQQQPGQPQRIGGKLIHNRLKKHTKKYKHYNDYKHYKSKKIRRNKRK